MGIKLGLSPYGGKEHLLFERTVIKEGIWT
jgi:hypothetical protein